MLVIWLIGDYYVGYGDLYSELYRLQTNQTIYINTHKHAQTE